MFRRFQISGTIRRWDSTWSFSGGKGIRGPQNAGLLLGKKDLIAAAAINNNPYDGVGRGMKVAKEQIVGMVAAVDWFLSQSDAGLEATFRHRAERISAQLKGIPTIQSEVVVPPGEPRHVSLAPLPTGSSETIPRTTSWTVPPPPNEASHASVVLFVCLSPVTSVMRLEDSPPGHCTAAVGTCCWRIPLIVTVSPAAAAATPSAARVPSAFTAAATAAATSFAVLPFASGTVRACPAIVTRTFLRRCSCR